MKFTIAELKKNRKLYNGKLKSKYGWDYILYANDISEKNIVCVKNFDWVNEFTPEEFALLLILEHAEDGWIYFNDCPYMYDINVPQISIEELRQFMDVIMLYLTRYDKADYNSNFEPVLSMINTMFNIRGVDYVWAYPFEPFDVNKHEAVGIAESVSYGKKYIVSCNSGGLKDSITGKMYKFPKVFVSND